MSRTDVREEDTAAEGDTSRVVLIPDEAEEHYRMTNVNRVSNTPPLVAVVKPAQPAPDAPGLLHRLKNQYALRKNAAHHLIDVALLMANVSQLKAMVDLGPSHPHFTLLMSFVILSISLQLVFALLVMMIWSTKELDKYKVNGEVPKGKIPFCVLTDRQAEFLDRVCVVVVLLIMIINMFITGFGLNPTAERTPIDTTNNTGG